MFLLKKRCLPAAQKFLLPHLLSFHRKQTSSHFSGKATSSGTSQHCNSKQFPLSTTLSSLRGLELSAVGFGGYRIGQTDSKHHQALKIALEAGMNVIDTSPNFGDGDSELLIGNTLEELFLGGKLKRENIFLMTKVGYIQASTLSDVKSSLDSFEHVAKISDEIYYSLAPTFIRESLQSSLIRLQVDHIDMFFLNNPEMYLSSHLVHSSLSSDVGSAASVKKDAGGKSLGKKISPQKMYEFIGDAFEFLEKCVEDGKISFYGVCSNRFQVSPSSSLNLSLEKLLSIACERLGPSHHFKAVQYPLNLFQLDPFLSRDAPSVVDFCQENSLCQFVNRPFTAILKSGSVKSLASHQFDDHQMVDFNRQLSDGFSLVLNMEKKFLETFKTFLPPIELISHGQQLSSNISLRNDAHLLKFYSKKFLKPSLLILEKFIDDKILTLKNDETPAKNSSFSPQHPLKQQFSEYSQQVENLFSKCILVAKAKESSSNEELCKLLDATLPSLKPAQNLTSKSIYLFANDPRIDCILVGCRTPNYVRNILDSLRIASSEKLAQNCLVDDIFPIIRELDK